MLRGDAEAAAELTEKRTELAQTSLGRGLGWSLSSRHAARLAGQVHRVCDVLVAKASEDAHRPLRWTAVLALAEAGEVVTANRLLIGTAAAAAVLTIRHRASATTETRTVAGHITVGYGATDVIKANTPRGQRAYVITAVESAPQDSGARNQLIAINTATGKVVARTNLPAEPGSLTVSKGGTSIWVGNENDGHLWKVSTTTGKITKTLKPTKAGPVLSMAVAPGGKKLWVTGMAGVAVLNAKTGKTTRFITAPKIANGYPLLNYLAFNGSGRYAYIVNSVQNNEDGQGQVTAINTKTYKVAWRIRTGSTPLGIATDTTHRTAYVPNYDDDTLTYFPITK